MTKYTDLSEELTCLNGYRIRHILLKKILIQEYLLQAII